MTWRLAGALLLVLVGIWAGERVYSSHHPATAVRVPVGEASAPLPGDLAAADVAAGPLVAKIPERLPDFSLGDRSGKATPIATWRGKSLILNFWATWCAPCRREIPLLESLATAWGGRNVEVVGVAVDHRENVLAYASELKIRYPLLIGEQDALDVAAALGVDAPVFPFTVFTDRRGQVVTLYVGELHQAQADVILSVVQKLDANQVELPEARRNISAELSALPRAPG